MDNAAYVADDAGSAAAGRGAASEMKQRGMASESEQARRRQKELAAATVRLPRTIGAVSGSSILIGSIVGAGIFISPAGVLRHSGSVGAALLIWLVCGAFEAVGALCYIELGLLMPEHGGDFTYLLRAFGPLHHFLGPLPAFLQSWLDVNVSNPSGTAVLALTFANYCVRPWYGESCGPPGGLEVLVAMLITITLTAANCIGVRWSTRLVTASTVAKMTAMTIIVAGGMYSLSRGNTQHLATGFQGSTTSSGELASAFLTCLWAYGGWKNLNNITEEVKNPARNLPLSILGSLPIVTLFYMLVNVAYLAVLSPHQMLASPAVAFSFGERALGPAAFLMPLGVALSVFGTLHGGLLIASRVSFAVARRGHHLHALSLVHVRWLTPAPALALQALITCLMILMGDIGALLRLSSFVNAFFNAMVLVALLVLRRTMPDAKRAYSAPLVLVWLRLAFCCYLVVVPIVDHPRTEYLYVLVVLGLGLAVYTPCVFYRWSPPLLARLTVGLQKLCQLLPSEQEENIDSL